MESILALQNPHWNNLPYRDLLEREVVSEMLHLFSLKEILVLQGIRRSGKSSAMLLMINELLKNYPGDEILYVNLEDPGFRETWDNPGMLRRLIEVAAKITGKKPACLFLDEIQMVNGWELFVKSAYDSESYRKIIVTGSNQALLNSQYASGISGRYVSLQIFPFSLNERISHLGIANKAEMYSNLHLVGRLIDEMMQYGGFPEISRTHDEYLRRKQLLGYSDSILMRDCISQHAIRDVRLFRMLTSYYLSTIGRTYTYSSLARIIGSNEHTVRDYLGFLSDAWLIREIYPWVPSMKTTVSGKKKGYCSDNGLISINSLSNSPDHGWLFENLVFTELLHNGSPDIRFYAGKHECDFIMKGKNKLTAIQACYSLTSENRDRELAGLEEAMKATGASEGMIITAGTAEELSERIKVVPVWEAFSH